MIILCIYCKLKKQTVDNGIYVLGGVGLKTLMPNILTSIEECLQTENLGELPEGALPTVYRADINGSLYYTRQYERVMKRNSFTVSYRDTEDTHRFIFVNHHLLAVLNTYMHFNLTSLFHVTSTDCFETVDASRILKKCLYIEFSNML